MANRTISVPDDVVPIIENLGMPFSRWVTDQLRRHGAQSMSTFAQQLEKDAELSGSANALAEQDAFEIGERMGRSAPW